MRWLLGTSIGMEIAGLVGSLVMKWPSLLFMFSQRAMDVGGAGILMAFVCWRGGSIEAAFDMGVHVGERRRRKRAMRVIRLPEQERESV